MFATLFVRAQIGSGGFETVVSYLGLAAIVVSAAWLCVQVIKWRTTYFVVTSHRLIYREGVVARNGVEIPLDRLNNVNFNQSIVERLLGVGDVLIESAGRDGQQTFTDISQPEKVQNIIHQAIQNLATGNTGVVSAFAGVAGELERLEALRDRGTLTDAEFREQKRRLLE
jgi:uncharacterized membrane protein YdbT with pleckstrin-like domain